MVLTSAVVTGLLTASCGADSEMLSKAEFIEQADAICKSTNSRMELVFNEVYAGLEDEDFDDQETVLAEFAVLMDSAVGR